MSFPPCVLLRISRILFLTVSAVLPCRAQLVCHESFAEHGAGAQIESGGNGSPGTGANSGAGWGGSYNVSNAIKSLVRAEDRTSNPVNYTNGDIVIRGGNRALRFYDVANGSYAVQRPMGTTFTAATGETLWFSVLFRAGNSSPLNNQDFVQLGFDDNAEASGGTPRVSIGANTTSAVFPSEFRFFARSTTAIAASDFADESPVIAAATTCLLVACIRPGDEGYDSVTLFVNPSSQDDPGPPSASVTLASGLQTLSHFFIRTVGLESGDAYVLDELSIGRDYGSVVRSLRGALRIQSAGVSDESPVLLWPVSFADAVLETSATLEDGSWEDVTGPYPVGGVYHNYAIPPEQGTQLRFFRLRR